MAARLDVIVDPKGAKIGGAEASRAIDGVKTSARGATNAVSVFNKSLAITTAAVAFTAALGKATAASIAFSDSIAEVSTLLDNVPKQLAEITDQAKRQSIEFGALPIDQAKAFYQIISAGASDATRATEVLTASNKLAVGGVTNVATAADGLTSVLNVYQDRVKGVTDVTDTLFVGMKQGKTTIGELASGIGRVAPLAEKLDISFAELVASIAALTKGGITTRTAIDGIRQVFAAILRPTSEAQKAASDLAFQFDAAALKSKGLSGFLSELTQVTEGSSKILAQFFGGVEALVPVLALSGSGAQTFTDILRAMDDRLGATDEAFRKIAESPGFAMRQMRALGDVMFIEVGDRIANVLIPTLRSIVDNFDDISDAAGALAVSLAVAFGPQIIALIGTQFVGAVGLATGAVNTLTAAIAANPYGAIAVAITAAVSALVFFGDRMKLTEDGAVTLQDVFVTGWGFVTESLGMAVDWWIELFGKAGRFIEDSIFGWIGPVDITIPDMTDSIKTGLNSIIGLFVGTYQSITENWGLLPDFFSSMMVKSVNVIISATELTINTVVNAVADFLENVSRKTIGGLNAVIETINDITGLDIDLLIEPEFKENEFKFTLDRIEDRADGTATRIGENLTRIWENAFSTDFIGDFVTEMERAVRKTAELRRASEERLPGLPGGPPVPETERTNLADLAERDAETLIETMRAAAWEANEIWETSFAGGYLDRLEEMVDATRDASHRMGEAFAEVFGPGGTLQRGFADSVARSIVFEEDLGRSMVNLGKRIAADLIAKFIETQLAMQTTAAISETTSAGIVATTSAVNKTLTAEALASQTALATGAAASGAAINAAYTPASITASIATSGGAATTATTAYTTAYGTMKAIAQGGGALPFARGGVFSNDIIDRPTAFPLGIMGEAGPEAILPLTRNSRGELGVSSGGGGASSGPITFAPSINVDIGNVNGGNERVGRTVAREVNQSLELAFNEFLRKQQRPGGRLNRQRVV